jgi:O-antigen/teichoic acid export membrane protein
LENYSREGARFRQKKPGQAGLVRSTLLNLSGLVVPIVVQLVTVPLYITTIGASRYGIMALVWLLLGYFGVFDLGFGRAIASRIAALSAAPATARANVFWTGTCLSILAGFLGGFVLFLVSKALFGGPFKIPGALLGETMASLPLLIVALPLITGISALSGALQGREAFASLNLSQMIGSILYQVFPLVIGLSFSVSLPWLVVGAIAGRFVTLVMLYAYCVKYVPAEPLPHITKAEIRPLFVFGSWVTLTGLVSPLLTVFDRFVIGSMAGMTAVTAYTIPYNLVMRISGLPSALQNALFPRFAMVGEDDDTVARGWSCLGKAIPDPLDRSQPRPPGGAGWRDTHSWPMAKYFGLYPIWLSAKPRAPGFTSQISCYRTDFLHSIIVFSDQRIRRGGGGLGLEP